MTEALKDSLPGFPEEVYQASYALNGEEQSSLLFSTREKALAHVEAKHPSFPFDHSHEESHLIGHMTDEEGQKHAWLVTRRRREDLPEEKRVLAE